MAPSDDVGWAIHIVVASLVDYAVAGIRSVVALYRRSSALTLLYRIQFLNQHQCLFSNLTFPSDMQFMEFTTCMCHATYFNDLTRFETCFITTVIITDQMSLPASQEFFCMQTWTVSWKSQITPYCSPTCFKALTRGSSVYTTATNPIWQGGSR